MPAVAGRVAHELVRELVRRVRAARGAVREAWASREGRVPGRRREVPRAGAGRAVGLLEQLGAAARARRGGRLAAPGVERGPPRARRFAVELDVEPEVLEDPRAQRLRQERVLGLRRATGPRNPSDARRRSRARCDFRTFRFTASGAGPGARPRFAGFGGGRPFQRMGTRSASSAPRPSLARSHPSASSSKASTGTTASKRRARRARPRGPRGSGAGAARTPGTARGRRGRAPGRTRGTPRAPGRSRRRRRRARRGTRGPAPTRGRRRA